MNLLDYVIVFVVAVLLLLLASMHSRASELNLTPETAAEVYALAYTDLLRLHPDLPLPAHAPRINLVSPKIICDKMDNAQGCGHVYGLAPQQPDEDGSDILLVNYLLYDTDTKAKSILYHEMIHYLQHGLPNHPVITCEQWLIDEHEAYALQAEALRKAGEYEAAYNVARTGAGQRCLQ